MCSDAKKFGKKGLLLILCVALFPFALLVLAVLTFNYGAPFRLLESEAEYHLRRLRWHGKETKRGDDQAKHGRALVALGERSVPLLIDEIRLYRYDGRYAPGPIRMLKEIGPEGRTGLLDKINAIDDEPEDQISHEKQRFALIAALIVAYDDLSLLDQWLSDGQHDSVRGPSTRINQLIFMVDLHLRDMGFPESPSLLAQRAGHTDPFNPDFINWWERTKMEWLKRDKNLRSEMGAPHGGQPRQVADFRENRDKDWHRRCAFYEKVFGNCEAVWPAPSGGDRPTVDLMWCRNDEGLSTLVTSGMSDARMDIPDGVHDVGRLELLVYLNDKPDEMIRLRLRQNAMFPFADETYLGHGDTINWMTPVVTGSDLTADLLITSITAEHRRLPFQIDGEDVELLWWVPITDAELRCKKDRGIDALLQVFDQVRHPRQLDTFRKSYVPLSVHEKDGIRNADRESP